MNKLISDEKTWEKVCKAISNGHFKNADIENIFKIKNPRDLLRVIRKFYDLSEHKKQFLWYQTIMNFDKHDYETVFNEKETIFFRELLECDGVLQKKKCSKIGIINTDWKIKTTAERLEEMGIIDIWSLKKEVLFVLSSEYYSGVFDDSEKK